MPFAIVTDSSANLPQSLIAKYGLMIVPLSYGIDGQMQTCPPSDMFDAAGFYQQLREGAVVRTSLCNTKQFLDVFEPLLKSGQDVLCLTISSGVSGTCQAASLAARELRGQYPDRQVFVADTKAASLGEGLLVLYAAQLREQGFSINATITRLTHKIPQLHQRFTVDDLMYLRRGGRISSITAIVGSMLHIRPLLRGEDGRIVVYSKARGRRGVIQSMVSEYRNTAKLGGAVAIVHSDAPEYAAELEAALRAVDPNVRILTQVWEPICGAHVGPGGMALFYFEPES